MPEYTVSLGATTWATCRVNAEGPDTAIDEALTEGIPGICAQCSGWRQDWSREDDDEWTGVSVSDSAMTTSPQPVESAEDELDEIWIRRARAALRDFRGALTSAENSLRGASRALSELRWALLERGSGSEPR